MGTLGSVGKKGLSIVNGAMAVTAGAVLAIGGASIKVGAEFEAGMSQVAATMGFTADEIRAGSAEFDSMKDAAKKAGRETQFSAGEAAEAMNYLALAGYSASEAVDTLPGVLNLAAAGGMDLGKAADLVTDGMGALGLSIEETADYVDKMAKTSQKSNTSVEQLGESIVTVGKNADGLAGGTVELNTALGLLANVGLKGADSGVKLRNMIVSLETPTAKGAKALENLGVQTIDAEGNMKGLDEIMVDLNKSMDGMTTSDKKEMLGNIFNKTDMAAALTLLDGVTDGTENLGMMLDELGLPMGKIGNDFEAMGAMAVELGNEQKYANYAMEEFGISSEDAGILYGSLMSSIDGGSEWSKLSGEIENADGAAKDMADTMNDNLQGDIKMLKSALEGLGVEIYESLGTPMRESTKWFSDWTNTITDVLSGSEDYKKSIQEMGESTEDFNERIKDMPPEMKKMAEAARELELLEIDVPEGAEGVAQVFGMMVTDMVENIADQIPELAKQGVEMVQNFAEGLSSNKDGIGESIATIMSTIIEFIASMYPIFIETGANILLSVIDGMVENIPNIIKAVIAAVKNIVDTLSNSLPQLLEGGKQIIRTLLEGIMELLPEVVIFVVSLIDMLATTLVELAPEILEAAGFIIITLLEGLIEAVPLLIEAAVGIIEAIAGFITENLGTVLELAITLIYTLAEGIMNNLGVIIDAALDIILALVGAIIDAYPLIIENGPRIIMSLVDGLLSSLTPILKAALEIILAIVKGLLDNIPKLASKIPEIIIAIVGAVLSNLGPILLAAGEIIFELIKGILKIVPQLIKAIFGIMVDIAEAIVGTDWIQIGKDILIGMWNGMKNLEKWLIDKITGLAGKITGGIKKFFGIKSPSKLMEDEVGENLSIGIGVGLTGGIPDILKDIKKDMPEITDTINGVLSGNQHTIGGVKSNPASTERAIGGGDGNYSIRGNVNTSLVIDGKEFARVVTPYVSTEAELENRRRGGRF